MTNYWLGLFPDETQQYDDIKDEVKENMSRLLSFLEYHGMKPPVDEVCPVIFTTKHVWENEND